MSYGGKDGKLDSGFVCFVRPPRKKPRKYSLNDLSRIFKYVVAENGLTAAYCKIAELTGITAELREALDAARDIPCVDTDITSLLPDGVKKEIEEFLGTDVDGLEGCDPETNIGQKLKSSIAILVAILIILRRMLRMRLLGFILKRLFLFALIEALADKLADIVQALLQTAAWVQRTHEVLSVLACQRDEFGNLRPISEVIDVPTELEELGL